MAISLKSAYHRWQMAVAESGRYQGLHRTNAFYFDPLVQDFNQFDSAGYLRGGRLYDATAARVVKEAAERIVSRVMPAGQNWLKIALPEHMSAGMSEEERHYHHAGLEKFSAVAQQQLERGNFKAVLHRCARNFLSVGMTAAMPLVEVKGSVQSVVFAYIPANQLFLEPAPGRLYGAAFWQRKMTALDWKTTYPNHADRIGNANDEQVFNVIFGFIPDADKSYQFAFREDGHGGGDFLFVGEDDPHERAIVTACSEVPGGETYGQGPAALALPEAQSLDAMAQDILRLSNEHANPLKLVSSGIPGKGIPYGPGRTIRADESLFDMRLPPVMNVPPGGDLASLWKATEERREMVRRTIGIGPRAAEPNTNVRSATEWVIAQAQERGDLDTLMEAFRDAFMKPLVQQAISAFRDISIVPPDLVVNDSGFSLEILGDSELQNGFNKLQRLNALLEGAQADPELYSAMLNHAQIIRERAKALNLTEFLASPEMVEANLAALRQARQQQAALGQQQQ